LDDPFSNDGASNAGGFGGLGYGVPPLGPSKSVAPAFSGGFAKSNYTASEAGDSEFDTHSQFQQKRKQWVNPHGGIGETQPAFGGLDDGYKYSGGGDLAGIGEIGIIAETNSRRGSFRAAGGGDKTSQGRGSESKERMREPSGTSQGFSAMQRPQTSGYDNGSNALGLRRPQSSEPGSHLFSGPQAREGIGSADPYGGAGKVAQRNQNMFSEVASSYKDEDDALSHYMGQSEYGGFSNIGGGAGIPTLER